MGQNTEYRMQLCAQGATEDDPTKLIALLNEIDDLLEQRERRFAMLLARKGDSERPPASVHKS